MRGNTVCVRAARPFTCHPRKNAGRRAYSGSKYTSHCATPGEPVPEGRPAWQEALSLCAAALASSALLHASLLLLPPPSLAVLNSPNAQIARTVDAALRRATPAFNPDVKQVQKALEDVQFLLRIPQRKPWGGMAKDVRDVQILVYDSPRMLAAVPPQETASALGLLETLKAQLERLQFAIDRKDPDKTSLAVSSALTTVQQLEVAQAPALSFQVPGVYRNSPLLTGRAMVEIEVEKADKSAAFVDRVNGGTYTRGKIGITLDGYSSPVSAGAFAKLVRDGKYDGKPWSSGYASVVTGRGAAPDTRLPLEILPIGEFEPVYRSPLDVRGGELPVLPLSIRGAVAMGRSEGGNDGYVSGDEWFIYKFDPSQAGLSGLAFDEGEFGVFGYVTQGMEEVVTKLDTKDVIVSARIVYGANRLLNAD